VSIAAIRESVVRANLDASAYEAGARRVQAANSNMAASGDRVALVQEKTTRATLNGAGAVERLQRELDKTYAAQSRFEQAQARIASATDRGHVSQARANELMDLARQRYLGAGQAAETAAGGLHRFGVAGNAAMGAAQGMASQLGPLGLVLGALGPAGVAAGVGIGGLITVLSAGVRAAEQFERLGLRTEAVVRATGGAAGYSAGQIRELSQEIARSTLASTEGVEAAAQKLLTFRSVAGETFARTLRAAQDLASVGFGTIESATVQLGKALENPAEGMSALTRIGITFSGAQKQVIESLVATGRAAEAQGVMLSVVEKQVGGAGKAEAGGLAGAYDTLGQNVQEFLVTIGNLGPIQAATAAINALAGAVGFLHKLVTPESAAAPGSAAVASAQSVYDAAVERQAQRRPHELSGLKYGQIAIERARVALEEAKRAEDQIIADAYARRAAMEASAALQQAAIQREAAAEAYRQQRLKHDKIFAAEETHRQELAVLARARNTGTLTEAKYLEEVAAANDRLAAARSGATREGARAARATAQDADARDKVLGKLGAELEQRQRMAVAQGEGEAATRALAEQIAIENALRDAGIPITGARTEAEERYARAIAETVLGIEEAKRREREIVEARAQTKRELDRTAREIESQAKRISDDVATSIYEGLVEGRRGQTVLAWFGNLFKRIAIQAASTNIILPITTAIVGGIPQLFGIGGGGAAGGGGGFGSLSSIGSTLQTGYSALTSGSLFAGASGFAGYGAGMSGALFGTPAIAAGGYTSAGAAATSGILGSGGSFSMAALGSTLGLAAGGFGAGMFANSLLGGNETNGMIGSAVGTAIGLALMPVLGPLGPILGGLLGGGGGGMLGPKESVKGWSYAIKADGANPAYGDTFGDRLKMDDVFYNDSGKAQFDQANAMIAEVNTYLAARGLTLSGARAVGGNKNGPDASWGGAASFADAFATFQFGAKDNTGLAAGLAGRSFGDPAELQAFVEGFLQIQEVIRQLTADAVPAYTASILAVNDNFAAVRAEADRLGASMEGLAEAQAKAIAEIEQARTETLRQSGVALGIRMMTATGRTQEAELARQAEAARAEVEAFGRALDALAITAEDKAARLVQLEETQAAERAAIIARWGEQAAAALRQAGGTIRAYLDSLETGTAAGASPTDRLAAAQEQFERDRILAMGGDRDALGRITGTADALLSAGRDMYASAPEFQDILAAVKSGLGGLPVLQSYDAMQAASLEAIQAAIENGTLNTATTIVPGGNIVQVANMADLAGLAAAISGLIDTSLQVGGATHAGLDVLAKIGHDHHATAVQQAAGIISLGVYLAAANDYLSAANWRLNHLVQLGEATNGSVATGAATNVAALAALTKVAADMHVGLAGALAVQTTGLAAQSAAQIAALNTGNTNATSIGNAHTTALGSLNTNTTASLAALNKITVDGNAAVVTSLALSNTLLGGILGKPVPVANDNRLIDINTSLATVDKSVRDVNTSLATVHGSVVAAGAAGVLAQNAGNVIAVDVSAAAMQARAVTNTHLAAILAATQAGTAHGLVTAGQIQVVGNHAHSAVLHIATHQQYTLHGNARIAEARDAQLAGNTLAAAQIARLLDLNASLATVDKSVRDVNASLATVDARVAAVMMAQNAGNTIAVDAAGSLTAGFAGLTTVTVDSNAGLLAAINAGNLIAVDAAGAAVAAQNAGNLITAGGADATVAALNAGNTIQATYYGQNMAQMQALIAEMQAMRAELAQLRNVTQQGAVLTANETRTGALLVAAKVEQVDDTLRKNAA